jgi:hypothetical protein
MPVPKVKSQTIPPRTHRPLRGGSVVAKKWLPHDLSVIYYAVKAKADPRTPGWKEAETMPTNIRAAISVIVVLVAAVVFYFESQAESGALKWVVVALATFMIYGLWLFPEAKRSDDAGSDSQS